MRKAVFLLSILMFLIWISLISLSVSAETQTIQLNPGWNMFSLPLNTTLTADSIRSQCGSTNKVWNYNPVSQLYEEAIQLLPGKGYWLKVGSACTVSVTGSNVQSIPGLKAGWNQIGSFSQIVNFIDVKGNCNVLSGPWKYNTVSGQYNLATSLEPGYGYWIKVSSDCNMGSGEEIPPIPLSACSDGTAIGICSATKPKYCDSGNLVDRCNICGCPTGYQCQADNSCGSIQACSDGTAYGFCSSTKPLYCSSGTLINSCSQCGCPSGYSCNTTTNSCYLTPPLTCDSTCKSQGYTSGTCEAGTSTKFNAIWVNGGMLSSSDLDFLASHKIFNLYWQVAAIKSDNNVYTAQYSGYTEAQVASKIDWIHSYDNRFKVLSWLAVRPELYGYPDLTTTSAQNTLINREVQHVQNCHFDGLATDLEMGSEVMNSNGSQIPGTENLIVQFWNAEAAAMHNLGKISAPFIFAGQGLWSGNFNRWEPYFSQIHVDYAVITLDHGGSEHTNSLDQIGYVETLHSWLQNSASPLAPALAYGGLQTDIAWTNDEVSQYGSSPKLAGFSLYDYVGGLPGTPPSNQFSYPYPNDPYNSKNTYIGADSPITSADWAAWDSWTLKDSGGTSTGTCQSGESSIGQDSCSSGSACCCKSNLVAYYKFDEGTGTTAFDSSPNKNNGALVNGPLWTTGKVGKALQFNGIDEYVKVNDSPSLRITGDMTISSWVYWKGSTNLNMIVEKGNQDDDNYGFSILSNGALRFEFNNSNSWIHIDTPASLVTPNTWQHIAVVYDDTNNMIYFYKNGVLANSTSTTYSLKSNLAYDLHIGCEYYVVNGNPRVNFFNGTLDEVKIWNRALTAAEIKNEYGVNTCLDGTAYDSCSTNKPLYCNNGNLVNKCSQCGCSSGTCQSDGSCQTIAGAGLMLNQYCYANWGIPASWYWNRYLQAMQLSTWTLLDLPAQIHQGYPGFIALYYRDLSRYSSYYSGEYEPENMATLQSFCLKDSTGAYVHAPGDSTWMYLDIGNPDFQTWYANYVADKVKTYGYDGVYMDDGFGASFWEIYYGYNNPPVNPRTGSTTWTDAEIQSYLISFYKKIRAAIGPNKLIIGNGIYTGSRWVDDNKTGYENVLSNSPIDGIMGEGWWKSSGTTDWYPESNNNPSWKDGVDAMIELETLYPNKYFVPVCYDYYDGVPNLPSGATVLQVARYCFASTLLGAQNNKNYLSLTNDAGYMEQFYKQLYSLDVGNPLGSYYVVTGTHTYERDFSKAKVLVNPSTSPYTVSLGGSYKTLDGQTVSSITMNAHTGEILLKNVTSSTCSDGTAYGQCSANKPQYCSSGTLINKCSQCGCPTGYTCQADGSCAQVSVTAGGLKGDYYDNIDFTNLKISRIDSTINFDWSTGSPDSSIGVDTFSVRWQGYVKADYAQVYTFYVTTDDGSRVWIDNNLVIDSWVDQWVGEYPNTGLIALTAGWHTIKYEYYENAGNAVAELSYSSPSVSKQIIPSDHLGNSGAVSTCDSTCKSQGFSSGTCEAGGISGNNLGRIPDDWGGYGTYGDVMYMPSSCYPNCPQITHVDYSVLHNGHVSVRIDHHVDGVDPNGAREVNGDWLATKPRDHIVFKCWIKTSPQAAGYANDLGYSGGSGGRLGIDFYGANGRINAIESNPNGTVPNIPGNDWETTAAVRADYVLWGSDWTFRVIDLIVPQNIGDTNRVLQTPTGFIPWLQAWGNEPQTGVAWFADCELYLNPTSGGSCQSGESSIGQDGCSSGSCCCLQSVQQCTPGTDIIKDTAYPLGSCQSSTSYLWSHSTCGSTKVCNQGSCKLVNASLTYTAPSGKYARSDSISIPYTIKNVGDIPWCFITEAGTTKSDGNNIWPDKFNAVAAGSSASDSLSYAITCSDPIGTWSGSLYSASDYYVNGGWDVWGTPWGTPTFSFNVVECLNDQDCSNCRGSSYTCDTTTNACYIPVVSTCDSTCKSQGFSSGTCEAGTSNTNLAVIPNDWGDYNGNIIYDGGTQITFLDYNVEHTPGKPSMRLEPHTSNDKNTAREVDGRWYGVSAGDVIHFGCWMKTDKVPAGYTPSPTWSGARVSFDYYDTAGISLRDADLGQLVGWGTQNSYVPYGSDWSWREATVTVPASLIDSNGATRHPSSMVLWVQVWDEYAGTIPNTNAWFADCELYINPTSGGSCQSGESSIGQDGCSSNNLCCCSGTVQTTCDSTCKSQGFSFGTCRIGGTG